MLQLNDRTDALGWLDQLLLEQGQFDPLEFLLAVGWLNFSDYEAWRLATKPSLIPLLATELKGALPAFIALLEDLHLYAKAQRLVITRQPPESWGEPPKRLKIGGGAHQKRLAELLCVRFETDPERTQLDLFHDSSASLLETHLRDALCARRPTEAAAALGRLADARPDHPRLSEWRQLAETPAALQALSDAQAHWQRLDGLERIAKGLLGARARDYLAPLWSALATRLANGQAPGPLHPAAAWVRAEHWQQARLAIEATQDWHTDPELIDYHARACWFTRATAEARGDWCRLCWEYPETFAKQVGERRFPDAELKAAWTRFEDADIPFSTEDFPAWLLIAAPALVPEPIHWQATESDVAEVFQEVRRLKDDPDNIALRENLSALHAPLLRAFLALRPPGRGRSAR